MLAKVLILVCAVAAVMAYPYADEEYLGADQVIYEPVEYQRVRREAPYQSPLQLQGGGGGNRKDGFGFSVDGKAPVWQSDNGRHQVDLSGGWSQHLGGPYGNSRPDKRVGAGYTFRF